MALYNQLMAAGVTSKSQTLLALAVSKEQLSGIGPENAAGFLSCMGYFQSIGSPANDKFVKAFKGKYGPRHVTGDTLACGYTWDEVSARSGRLRASVPRGSTRVEEHSGHVAGHVRGRTSANCTHATAKQQSRRKARCRTTSSTVWRCGEGSGLEQEIPKT